MNRKNITFENQEFSLQSMKMHYIHYVANLRSALELSKEMCESRIANQRLTPFVLLFQ